MASAQDQITAFLRGKGLTAAQIAGVEGNLQTESGFRSTASNPGEGAIGIAQWEGGRRTNLDAFAKAAGTSETDLQTQLAFMWSELTGSESGALTSLLATTNVTDAATVFDRQYERSSAASLPARVGNAQAILASGLQGGSGQVNTTGSGSGQAFGVQNANFVSDAAGGILGTVFGSLGSLLGIGSGSGDQSSILGGIETVGRWLLDGFLIVIGAVLIIVAIVLVAKSGDSAAHEGGSSPAPSQPAPTSPASEGEHEGAKSGAKAGAAGAAEDTAEVAAVAA